MTKDNIIKPIAEGQRISIEDVNDQVFSKKLMGEGIAFIPNGNQIYAPFDGTIVTVFPTKHAYGVKRNDGLEAIIHIGLDTVSANGEGFTSLVETNQKVMAGDIIAEVDFEYLKKKGYDVTTILVFPEIKNRKIEWTLVDKNSVAAI